MMFRVVFVALCVISQLAYSMELIEKADKDKVPAQVAPKVEMMTVRGNEREIIAACYESLGYAIEAYWRDEKSCKNVTFNIDKLRKYSQEVVKESWQDWRFSVLAKAKRCVDNARQICNRVFAEGFNESNMNTKQVRTTEYVPLVANGKPYHTQPISTMRLNACAALDQAYENKMRVKEFDRVMIETQMPPKQWKGK